MNAGEIAPNFILKDESGKDFELYKNLDQNILLVFYPKDDTPVCSSQLAHYNDNIDVLSKNEIKVVGINIGSINSHSDFCKKLNLKFPLLADEDKKVSKQFGAINFLGINKRLNVLIGTDRKIVWIASSLSITYLKSAQIIKKTKLLKNKEMT